MWTAARAGRIKDVDERRDAACVCKYETAHDGKEGRGEDGYDRAWGEDMINTMDGFLVAGDGSAKYNNAGSNMFLLMVITLISN